MFRSVLSSSAQMAKFALTVLFAAAFIPEPANSQGFLETSNLQSYCEKPSVRQTIIYVDQSVVIKDDRNWAIQLLNKLDFLPRERTHVVRLKAGSAEAEQLFSLCYPDLTASELADAQKKTGTIGLIFQGDPKDQLKKAQEQFMSGIRIALSATINAGVAQESARVNPESPPSKALLESLFYDEKRFALENGVSRVIIYSNMLQNSEQVPAPTTGDVRALARKASEQFQTRFNRSEFHVFGVGTTSNAASTAMRSVEQFWRDYLLLRGASLEQFSTNLSLNPIAIQTAQVWEGALITDKQHIEARLRLMTDSNGRLTNSWLGVLQVGDMPITGTLKCDPSGACDLDASFRFDSEYFAKGDKLVAKGTPAALDGEIKAPVSNATMVDGKPFAYKVGFKRQEAGLF